MATVLSGTKSTYGSPACYYYVYVNPTSRTPSSVTFKWSVFCRMTSGSSYLGTGKSITAYLYIGGAWRGLNLKASTSTWSGTTEHSATSGNITISATPSDTAITNIYFQALRTDSIGNSCQLNQVRCSNVSISNAISRYTNVAIAAATPTQRECKVTLSGLPSACGYGTGIDFYKDGVAKVTLSKSSSTTVTSYSYTFKDLLPNTTYTFGTRVRYSTNTILSTKTVSVTTPRETGEIGSTASATYIIVNVTGMFDLPNYDRVVDFYYRKAGTTDYTLYDSVETQSSYVSCNIVGLISNQEYEFKVNIKNGTIIEKTLTTSEATLQDTSLIPTGIINGVTQRLGTRNCSINWVTDKEVSGTVYTLQCKKSTGTQWETLATLTSRPQTVVSPYGNTNVNFRIATTNTALAAATTTYSNVYTFYVRDDFVWDTAKVQGNPLAITANEWNRLRDYVIVKHPSAVIPLVRIGDPITAETYNTMKNAIGIESIDDKSIGDAIAATDIDALRVNINA